jgi:hypothetical protein
MNKDSKKTIIIDEDVNIHDFIKNIREGLETLKQDNQGIFGDDELLTKLESIDKLESWEQNLLFMFIYFGALRPMQKYTNVSYCTLSKTIRNILEKARLNV